MPKPFIILFSFNIDNKIQPEPVPKSRIFLTSFLLIKLLAISTINSVSGLGSKTSLDIKNVEL